MGKRMSGRPMPPADRSGHEEKRPATSASANSVRIVMVTDRWRLRNRHSGAGKAEGGACCSRIMGGYNRTVRRSRKNSIAERATGLGEQSEKTRDKKVKSSARVQGAVTKMMMMRCQQRRSGQRPNGPGTTVSVARFMRYPEAASFFPFGGGGRGSRSTTYAILKERSADGGKQKSTEARRSFGTRQRPGTLSPKRLIRGLTETALRSGVSRLLASNKVTRPLAYDGAVCSMAARLFGTMKSPVHNEKRAPVIRALLIAFAKKPVRS